MRWICDVRAKVHRCVGGGLLGALLLTTGCAAPSATSMSPAQPSSVTPELGLLKRAEADGWRVEARIQGGKAVLRLWQYMRSGSVDPATPAVENRQILPSSLAKPVGDWALTRLDIRRGRLNVALHYQPITSAANYQDKQFEFDLTATGQPLVHYLASTVRGDKADWMAVDFVTSQAQSCRQAPASTPRECQPSSLVLIPGTPATLANMGNAEDYVPPIKMEVRY